MWADPFRLNVSSSGPIQFRWKLFPVSIGIPFRFPFVPTFQVKYSNTCTQLTDVALNYPNSDVCFSHKAAEMEEKSLRHDRLTYLLPLTLSEKKDRIKMKWLNHIQICCIYINIRVKETHNSAKTVNDFAQTLNEIYVIYISTTVNMSIIFPFLRFIYLFLTISVIYILNSWWWS